MNTTGLTRQYGLLTPEERFRLILAASGRGDEAERDRLARAGRHITLSSQDHAPYAHAFADLGHLMYVELLEEAARYLDAFALIGKGSTADETLDFDDEAEREESTENTDEAEAEQEDTDGRSRADQAWDLVFAAGFVLQTKADGWNRYCERLCVPPLLVWRHLPGFHRLERALTIADGTESLPGPVFFPEGMVRFLNRIRPEGTPAIAPAALMTAEKIADELDGAYRERSQWWGG